MRVLIWASLMWLLLYPLSWFLSVAAHQAVHAGHLDASTAIAALAAAFFNIGLALVAPALALAWLGLGVWRLVNIRKLQTSRAVATPPYTVQPPPPGATIYRRP